MRSKIASGLMFAAYGLFFLATCAAAIYDVVWSYQVFPDLVAIILVIPTVCAIAGSVVGAIVALPLVGAAYLLDANAVDL